VEVWQHVEPDVDDEEAVQAFTFNAAALLTPSTKALMITGAAS
jgi:hypothetical protein